MASIKDAIHAAIDQDVILRTALSRGIVNKKAAARWLQKHRGIEGSFDTVYEIVSEYDASPSGEPGKPWESLATGRLGDTKDVDVLTLPWSKQVYNSLPELLTDGLLAYQDSFRIIPSIGSKLLLCVESDVRQRIVDKIGAEVFDDVERDLFQISLRSGEGGNAGAGALALIVLSFVLNGIEVRYVATGSVEDFIIVPKDQETQAIDLLGPLFLDPRDEFIDDA